jgi:hypothetical protein
MIDAAEFNITERQGIRRGTDYQFVLFARQSDKTTAIDLTGWAVRCEIRKRRDRESPLLATFTVSIPTPANGEIYMSLTETQTEAIPTGEWPYDVLFTDTYGEDFVYIFGNITSSGTVTVK